MAVPLAVARDSPGLPGEQVAGQQQDRCFGDDSKPCGEAEEAGQAVRAELAGGQAPPSAPVRQVRRMRIRPRGLFPSGSILASNPAVRPTAIHAIMPITDSFGRRRNDAYGSQSCWVDRGGRIILPRVHRSFGRWPPGRNCCVQRKSGPCPYSRKCLCGCSCQGPERYSLCYYTFPDCRILEFGSDHSAADGGGGRPAFSNVRAWPHGGEHLRAIPGRQCRDPPYPPGLGVAEAEDGRAEEQRAGGP